MTLNTNQYQGVIVPMVTPLNENQSVDVSAVKILVGNVVNSGALPFVLGSTGEGYSLSLQQKSDMVKATVNSVGSQTLVYAGLTSNSLSTAIEEANLFASLGVNVLVATLPFYYPIDEAQMLLYFNEMANALPLPLIIYNMPGMVKQSIPLHIADELSRHHNIVGLKDSERDTDRMIKALSLWSNRTDFSYLIGWTAMSEKGLQLGADGIVPSTGNICPEMYVELFNAVKMKNVEHSNNMQELTNKISAIYQQNRDLSRSIPALKCMLMLSGKCQPFVAPPLYRMSENEEKDYLKIAAIKLKELGL